MAEPILLKKVKLEEGETRFFYDFLHNANNQVLIKRLRKCKSDLSLGDNDLNVSFLRVLKANAADGESFSYAKLDVEEIVNDGYIVKAPFAVFFLEGYRILEKFLSDEDPMIPVDPMKRRTLRYLLQFLTQDHTILAEHRGKGELDWKSALRFAQHLLIQLVPNKTFLIDSNSGLNLQLCCQVEHPMAGVIGDTSFGCSEGWHGEVDIMILEKEVTLTVMGAKSGSEYSDVSSISPNSAIEGMIDMKFPSSALQRLMGQTIVFSFLQRKQKEQVSNNCLVPGIGICAEKLIVYMYDCVEDVLVEAMPLDLFSDERERDILYLRAVLILWMILNYREFGNRIPEKYTKYKSEFHQLLGPKLLEVYRNKVEMPCRVKPSEKHDHQPKLKAMCLENVHEFFEYLPASNFISLSKK